MHRPTRAQLVSLITQNKFRYALVAAFFLTVYAPYVLHGGFIIDDWGVLYAAKTADGFWRTYANWFPLFSNRPLSPLLLTVVSRTFWQWEPGYILLNLALWFSAISIMAKVFTRHIGDRFALFFVLFSGLPLIASSVIFSTVMQLTATASIAVWAVSFYCITRFAQEGRGKLLYLASFACILVSLLTYEIILPLLFLSILFPALILKKRPPVKAYLKTYLLPIILVVAADLVFQKLVMPHYMQVFSRFNPVLDAYHIAGFGYLWLKAVLYLSPIKIAQSFGALAPATLNPLNTIAAILLAIFSYVAILLGVQERPQQIRRLVSVLCFACFGAYLLYLAASRIPTIGGYENRGLSSAWLVLAMAVALLITSQRKYFVHIVAFAVFMGVTCGFLVERDNYIASYSLQKEIVSSVMRLSHDQTIPAGATILGNVPHYLPTNYNNEEVFNNPWDFGEALYLASNGSIAGGNTFTHDKAGSVVVGSQKMTMEGWWDASYDNLWYFDYSHSDTPTLTRISGPDDLRNLVSNL